MVTELCTKVEDVATSPFEAMATCWLSRLNRLKDSAIRFSLVAFGHADPFVRRRSVVS